MHSDTEFCLIFSVHAWVVGDVYFRANQGGLNLPTCSCENRILARTMTLLFVAHLMPG